MKSTAAVTFSQICALYVLLGCSPASTAPLITDTVPAIRIKPYADYNKTILPYIIHGPLEILDEKIGGNVSATTSQTTTPIIGIISDENTGYSRSKQKDFKYAQFQSFLEVLTSVSTKFKATSMTTEPPFGEELTANSFNDLVTSDMLQTKHPSTDNKKKLLYPRTESAIAPFTMSYAENNETTTMTPTPIITTTTQRPKPNKFTCTLCVIIIVNE